jgi:hypothetical protein
MHPMKIKLYWILERTSPPLLAEESSIQDPPIGNIVVDHASVTYKIVDELGNKKKKNLSVG